MHLVPLFFLTRCTGSTDADGVGNANMTNLAIKAILGVKVMSQISSAIGEKDDATKFSVGFPFRSLRIEYLLELESSL